MSISDKPTVEHQTKWGKTEIISSKVRNKTRLLLLSLSFNTVLEFIAKAIR
jgi:hypothetical protein